jgi:hypothetical protein
MGGGDPPSFLRQAHIGAEGGFDLGSGEQHQVDKFILRLVQHGAGEVQGNGTSPLNKNTAASKV